MLNDTRWNCVLGGDFNARPRIDNKAEHPLITSSVILRPLWRTMYSIARAKEKNPTHAHNAATAAQTHQTSKNIC